MPTMLMYLIRSSDDCKSSVVNRTQVFDADFLDTIPINFIPIRSFVTELL